MSKTYYILYKFVKLGRRFFHNGNYRVDCHLYTIKYLYIIDKSFNGTAKYL